ncbi:DNA translocase FtsK, partial [uncultured Alistipes sp.]
KHKVVAHHAQDEAFDDPEPEAPRPRREPDPVPDAAPAREAETPAAREEAIPAADGGDEAPAAAAGEVEIERPAPAPEAAETPEPEEAPAVAEKPAGEEDPFLELTTDEAAAPAVPSAATSAPGRVVMGDDGLIELDLSDAVVLPDPAPAAAAARPQAAPKPSEPEDGLMEVTLLGDEERIAPAQQMNAAEYPFHGSEAAPAAAEPADDETPAPEEEGIVVTVEEHDAPMMSEASIPTEAYDPLKDLVNYRKPPVTLLEDYRSDSEVSDEEIYENKSRIEETLKYFGIPIQRIKATVGPTVTLYEIVQAQGVKISKIQGLENDIAQSLKALGIRIIAPIPGKGTIGIEVPNRDKQVVSMYSAVRSMRFQESKAELPVVIGRTIQNENYVFDLAKMPHLLVAGATGQGKSVGLNAIITSLLYTKHPAQLKFVMIDPKMVEFSLYAKIEKHFLAKMESEEEAVITDPKKAVYTLNSLCVEMDNRLELCKKAGARNIAEYNDKFVARRLNPQHGHHYLPYIVVVVDEFADLIMTAREVEAPVMRLAQKARAIGIHLIIATQRPDVKVITGGIKANFPARIAFRVMQMIDSRTIIDQPGANQLIGRGDMLFSKDGELVRIQCALVETKEVERVVEHISKQQSYTAAYSLPDYTPETGSEPQTGGEGGAPVKFDALFAEIARTAVSGGSISTSMIQRNYEVGFNRAGRIMLQLERAGIVGRQEGAKPRDILYHDLPSLEAKLQELGLF